MSVMINNIIMDWKETAAITQPKAAINVATMILIAIMPLTHLLGKNDQNVSRVLVIMIVSIAEKIKYRNIKELIWAAFKF